MGSIIEMEQVILVLIEDMLIIQFFTLLVMTVRYANRLIISAAFSIVYHSDFLERVKEGYVCCLLTLCT